MMILDLICFNCLLEQVNKGATHKVVGAAIPTPFEQVNNSGIYQTTCSKGHKCKTVIDNIDFEILFEYGLNAIVDGYYREAVSTLTVAMERYFEFFIKSTLKASKVEFSDIDQTWKNILNHSERQFGAYITLYCQSFNESAQLLNTGKEISFRNSVIHKGYIPSKTEVSNYGNSLMLIIENSLNRLKQTYPEAVNETFDYYGYKGTALREFERLKTETGKEQDFACVNIMTTINVINGREIHDNDRRKRKC